MTSAQRLNSPRRVLIVVENLPVPLDRRVRLEATMLSVLNAIDIGVSPDPKNPMNDISTMNKVMEYMTLEKPLVQFDLTEGRASAGESALYARANDPEDFAAKIAWLIDHPAEGVRMGKTGRARVLERLSWEHSAPVLLAAYDRIFAKRG